MTRELTSGIYESIADHATLGRAGDIDPEEFRAWLASIDLGNDPTFAKFDDVVDELVERYRAIHATQEDEQ